METVVVGRGRDESNPETQVLLCSSNQETMEEVGQGRGCMRWLTCREEVVEEGKRQIWLAGPLIGVSLLQYSLQVIAIMFVGHLGNLPLSGASLASSFANVTAFSVLVFCLHFILLYTLYVVLFSIGTVYITNLYKL